MDRSPAPDKLRILLIDGSPLEIVRLASLLEPVAGLAIVGSTTDAAQGLERAAELVPDVVAVDVHIGPADRGLALLRQLCRRDPRLRVLVLTHFVGHAVRRVFEAAGACACFDRAAGLRSARDWLAAEAARRAMLPA